MQSFRRIARLDVALNPFEISDLTLAAIR